MISLPKGVKVANYTDTENITGTTAFLFEKPVLCSVDRRGGAFSTRQMDPLDYPHIVDRIDAVVVSGGSAFGLRSADGVVEFIREKGRGFLLRGVNVPRVPTACIFDLLIGKPVSPSPSDVYKSCQNAKDYIEESGCVGAGTGATVGKIFGIKYSTKSGIGFEKQVHNGIESFSAVCMNAFGEVLKEGNIIAGPRESEKSKKFVRTLSVMEKLANMNYSEYFSNTIVSVVITNAILTKEELRFLAAAVNSSLSTVVRPSHTPFDGDIAFFISLEEKNASFPHLYSTVWHTVQKAAIDAVEKAKGIGGIPSSSEIISDCNSD